MHRVDTDGNVGNLFDDGDPGVPRAPTQVDAAILNAFQEELMHLLEQMSIPPIKGTNTQVYEAVGAMIRYCGAVIGDGLDLNGADANYPSGPNILNASNIVKAYGTVTLNGSAIPTLSESYNVASLSYGGSTNILQVNFNQVMADALYAVVVTLGDEQAGTPAIIFVRPTGKHTDYFKVAFYDLTNAGVDYSGAGYTSNTVNFAVFGLQAP